ncbi:MAG: hypothetical protein ACREL9_08800 [Gemmatimonadales bacterium]
MGKLVLGLIFLFVALLTRTRNRIASVMERVLVPTEGGLPVLNLGELRRNLRQP